MIKEVIEKLAKKEDLSAEEMKSVFYELMDGKAEHEDMKRFLISLAEKKETVEEITEAAKVMREKMTKIDLPYDTILDTCGTGGGLSSFNVSTIVAIVAAGVGLKVAKHGNRSYTSHCGSADLLQHLGVKIDLDPNGVRNCIKEVGIGFLFAPLYHPAMKYVAEVRRKIKRRTIFNILGPLSNPAGANVQLLGTYDEKLTEVMAKVLGNLGTKRAFVVSSLDGFDEVSVSDQTKVSELKDGRVSTYNIKPEDFMIRRIKKPDVTCKDLKDNLDAVKSILEGEITPKREMVLVNTAVALVAAGHAQSFIEGLAAASNSIDSGKAKEVLDSLIKFTNR